MSTISAKDLAGEVQAAVSSGPAAVSSVLASHYAEKLLVGHEPPLSADGTYERDVFVAHMEAENAAFERALTNLKYDSRIEVSGNDFAMNSTLSGTTADGTDVEAVTRLTYTLENGEIVKIITEVDSETAAKMVKVLSDAGFQIRSK